MSFVAWQILRRLPKPLLLVLLIFALVAAARASQVTSSAPRVSRHLGHL
jgi:hypothetical protein